MLIQFQEYLSFENLYILTSFGILPFWILLIIIPDSKVTQFFVNSIILPLILSTAYIYVVYQIILLDEPIFDIFKIYISLDNLYTIFANESFLLIFWLHFLSLNLFLGSWITRDAIKYNIPRKLVFVPLLVVYFTGPSGIVLYWIIRIFYSKRLSFHD
jgi:hypothetical protein|tara:strand:- start:198 stop:671 length:474 start_codon:yes stop_codon:yes gene_type:complete